MAEERTTLVFISRSEDYIAMRIKEGTRKSCEVIVPSAIPVIQHTLKCTRARNDSFGLIRSDSCDERFVF